MNKFTLDQINEFLSSKEGIAKTATLKSKLSKRISQDMMDEVYNEAYLRMAERVIEEGGEIQTDKTLPNFVMSYINVSMLRNNTIEHRHQARQQRKVFDQDIDDANLEANYFGDQLYADEDVETEVDVKMRVEAMSKILDDQDFYILKEIVYLGRSTNALSQEFGISPYLMGQRVNEIYEKVEKYLN